MIKDYLRRNKYCLLILIATFIIGALYNNTLILIGIFILILTGNIKFSNNGKADTDFILLSFISLSYFAFAYANNNVTIAMAIMRFFPSLALYTLGYSLIRKNRDHNYWYFLLLTTTFLTSLVCIKWGIEDTIRNGFIVPERMFGSEKDDFGLTTSLIASQLIPTIACIGLFFDNPCMIDDKKLRWFGIVLAILGELCAIHYVSRAGMLIMALSIVIGLMYRSSFNFKTILYIIIVIFAYFIFTKTDAYAAFELKNETGGDIATGNGRDVRMQYWLQEIIGHPLGIPSWTNRYNIYGWAHNFWIDFTKECGWIPGIALILFSIRNLYFIIRISLRQSKNKSVTQLILLLGIAYFLTLFTEPTMQGAPLLMFSYFMFCGIVKSIYKLEK